VCRRPLAAVVLHLPHKCYNSDVGNTDNRDMVSETTSPAAIGSDLRQIRQELKAEAEKLKTLEIRVSVIEQNLLGN
jgi:hypothetical protein